METNGRPDKRPVFDSPAEALCARCGGLMVTEHYMDLQDDTGQVGLTALRCTGCGEVVDAVILQNRVKPAPNLLYGTRKRKYAQRVDEDEMTRTDENKGS